MNIDILLKRYYTIRKAWINSTNTDQEKEYYDKLQILEKEIKAFKARKGTAELGSEVMAKYIGLKENGSREVENGKA